MLAPALVVRPMSTPEPEVAGTLALVGGGEWRDGTRDLDAALLEASGGTEVLVLPTAAAYEHPERIVEVASAHFAKLGATVRALPVLHRTEAESAGDRRDRARRTLRLLRRRLAAAPALGAQGLGAVRRAARGLPQRRRPRGVGRRGHRAVRPDGRPRGGAYTVGPRRGGGVAVFPYHGSAADHLRERSIDLLPANAVLVGIDEETALLRQPGADWSVAGKGLRHPLHRANRAPAQSRLPDPRPPNDSVA